MAKWDKFAPTPGAFVFLNTKYVTGKVIYKNTQWPAEDERVARNPDLAAAVEIVRLKLAGKFALKEIVGANDIANKLDPIYEAAGLSPEEARECKLANLTALHHTRSVKVPSSIGRWN